MDPLPLLLDLCQRARVVGISGPQGCGKSTLAARAVEALESAVAVSIDDFYLTRVEQEALAASHPGDRTLEHRGYPGTHDVALGASVLRALASPDVGEVRVPVYDKGAFGGRGDRAAAPRVVRTPIDVVLVEGWMLGFRAVASPPSSLRAANGFLPAYDAWHDQLDAFLHLDAIDPTSVVRWRVDAERARRARTGIGLTDDEARDYVERFVPAYETWVPGLRAAPPGRRHLRLRIAEDRSAALC